MLDLGAAPGSWSAYAAERIGPNGRLLAVDLKPLAQPPPAPHKSIEADALTIGQRELEEFAPYHVVLSDMAPNTTGHRSTDR